MIGAEGVQYVEQKEPAPGPCARYDTRHDFAPSKSSLSTTPDRIV